MFHVGVVRLIRAEEAQEEEERQEIREAQGQEEGRQEGTREESREEKARQEEGVIARQPEEGRLKPLPFGQATPYVVGEAIEIRAGCLDDASALHLLGHP